MTRRPVLDTIDLHLVRVLHTLLTERSVSRAALRLASTQPAVSAQLKRLRTLTGDPLLVRSGAGMRPTEGALALIEPAANLLREAERLFGNRRTGAFDPANDSARFRIAASDYLDPLFLPALVAHVKREAPGSEIELMPLSPEFDHRRALAAGDVDLVIGNALAPPAELHLGRLFTDEVVCLVARGHPAVGRDWTVERYLACEHVAPRPAGPGSRGMVDDHLAALGLERRIAVRASHFGLLPRMVADSLLVLTTGRLFCSRYVDTLPVQIVRAPVAFPAMVYHQLWHDATHAAPAQRWLREQVREVARRVTARAGRPRTGAEAGDTSGEAAA